MSRINLTVCQLAEMLGRAKHDHTEYEERFKREGNPVPEHRWESWYARHIIQQIKDLEYNTLFGSVDVTADIRPSPCDVPYTVTDDVANSAHKDYKPTKEI